VPADGVIPDPLVVLEELLAARKDGFAGSWGQDTAFSWSNAVALAVYVAVGIRAQKSGGRLARRRAPTVAIWTGSRSKSNLTLCRPMVWRCQDAPVFKNQAQDRPSALARWL